MNNRLVWIDLEMTGLNPEVDQIIEIAVVITDSDLNIIAQAPVIAIQTPDEVLNNMTPFVKEMHTNNGLLYRVSESTVTLKEAEQTIFDFICEHVGPNESPLCGNSVHCDKAFLVKQMPSIANYLHYRIIDVSTLKVLANMWGILENTYVKKTTHLALDDIYESINELRFYREHLLKQK